MALEEIEIEEKELEQILYDNPHYLEEGLKPINRQFPTDSGPLDLLCVDDDNVLVVIELKNEEDDYQLLQALRYYDYIAEHIYELSHHFSTSGITISTKDPRLMLVAPSFSDTLKRAAKYLGIEIDLKEYIAVKMPNGEIGLIIRDVEIPGMQPSPPPTINEKLDRIRDKNLKEVANKILEELKRDGVELRPIHGDWISLFYKNKKLASMACRRTRLVVEIPTQEGKGKKHYILKEEDWLKVYHEKLKPLMALY
ncbi:MAG: endonuclease NucS [Candidatus Bathyarchaeia archaeon]